MSDTPKRSDEVFELYPSYLSGKNGLKTRNDVSGVYIILQRGVRSIWALSVLP